MGTRLSQALEFGGRPGRCLVHFLEHAGLGRLQQAPHALRVEIANGRGPWFSRFPGGVFR